MTGETPRLAPIFISYSFRDAAAARRVAASLTAVGLSPWLVSREVAPGESFVKAINAALGEAQYVVLLVSHYSMASPWVEREWMAALAKKGTVLVPVRLDDAPLPPLLGDILSVDFTQPGGAQALQEFFLREGSSATEKTRADPGLGGATRRELRLVMQRCLDRLAFREILFDLEIDEGSLPGESLHEQILFLLHAAERQVTMDQLIDTVERDHAPCVRAQLVRLRASP